MVHRQHCRGRLAGDRDRLGYRGYRRGCCLCRNNEHHQALPETARAASRQKDLAPAKVSDFYSGRSNPSVFRGEWSLVLVTRFREHHDDNRIDEGHRLRLGPLPVFHAA